MKLHCLALSAALCGLLALPAQAALSGPVTVQLLAPGGVAQDPGTAIALSQTVSFAALSTGVQAGNLGGSGDVSGFMLDNERVFFVGQSIKLRVAVGDDSGGLYTTGYLGSGALHARYQFDGLAIAGQAITGFQVYAFDGFASAGATGLIAPASPAVLVQLVDADSLSFDLDTLVFAHRFAGSSSNYAEFRIDLITSAVPEPAGAGLLIVGLGLLAVRRRA